MKQLKKRKQYIEENSEEFQQIEKIHDQEQVEQDFFGVPDEMMADENENEI